MQREIPLLRVPQLLHVSSELDLLDREPSQLGNHGAGLQAHVLGEHSAEQVEGEAPAAE